jgi:hypothetical protein
MPENLSDRFIVFNECNYAHRTPAPGTYQGIDLADLLDLLCPVAPEHPVGQLRRRMQGMMSFASAFCSLRARTRPIVLSGIPVVDSIPARTVNGQVEDIRSVIMPGHVVQLPFLVYGLVVDIEPDDLLLAMFRGGHHLTPRGHDLGTTVEDLVETLAYEVIVELKVMGNILHRKNTACGE